MYGWRTPEGKQAFAARIKALLADVDNDPERADNPVSDFLRSPVRIDQPLALAARIGDIESRVRLLEGAFQLLGRGVTAEPTPTVVVAVKDESLFDERETMGSWFEAGQQIAATKDSQTLRKLSGRAAREIRERVPGVISKLDAGQAARSIKREQIAVEALKFESGFAPYARNIEQFSLGLATTNWAVGARAVLQMAGALISSSEGLSGTRFAVGLPAFFAWRLLLLAGAGSVQEQSFDFTSTIVNEPIPVTRYRTQATYRSLKKHRDLFYPDAVLGYANVAIGQLASMYSRSPHIHAAFATEDEFRTALAEFLIIIALQGAHDDDRQIYPGYRLLPTFGDGARSLVSRIVTDPAQRDAIGRIFGLTGDELVQAWPALARGANQAELGPEFWVDGMIPTNLDGDE